MLGRASGAVLVLLATACSLTTDLDGLAGSTRKLDGGTSAEGGRVPDDSTLGPDAGCTVPTDADPNNCGACGKSCRGGACVVGTCQATPLLRGVVKGLGLGIAGSKLYVADQSGLLQANLDGTELKTVVSGVEVRYIFGADADVFFSDGLTSSVRRWSTRDSGPSVAVTSGIINNLLGVAATANDVYFARYTKLADGGGVYRVPLLAGGAATLVKAWEHPEGLTIADGVLYIGSDGTDTAAQLASDGTPRTLLNGGGPTGIFVLGDDAFITRQGAGEVVHVSLSTSAIKVIAAGQNRPSGIVATADAVYWVEYGNGNLTMIVR